jgi:hypothetical protein
MHADAFVGIKALAHAGAHEAVSLHATVSLSWARWVAVTLVCKMLCRATPHADKEDRPADWVWAVEKSGVVGQGVDGMEYSR